MCFMKSVGKIKSLAKPGQEIKKGARDNVGDWRRVAHGGSLIKSDCKIGGFQLLHGKVGNAGAHKPITCKQATFSVIVDVKTIQEIRRQSHLVFIMHFRVDSVLSQETTHKIFMSSHMRNNKDETALRTL